MEEIIKKIDVELYIANKAIKNAIFLENQLTEKRRFNSEGISTRTRKPKQNEKTSLEELQIIAKKCTALYR